MVVTKLTLTKQTTGQFKTSRQEVEKTLSDLINRSSIQTITNIYKFIAAF